MRIVHYSTLEEIENASRICLKEHLHKYSGGVLYDWYNYAFGTYSCNYEKRYSVSNIFIYFIENQPVGAFVILNKAYVGYDGANCSVFVKREYRRQGIATELIQYAKNSGTNFVPWFGGYEASALYQKALNITNVVQPVYF